MSFHQGQRRGCALARRVIQASSAAMAQRSFAGIDRRLRSVLSLGQYDWLTGDGAKHPLLLIMLERSLNHSVLQGMEGDDRYATCGSNQLQARPPSRRSN